VTTAPVADDELVSVAEPPHPGKVMVVVGRQHGLVEILDEREGHGAVGQVRVGHAGA